ncbi:bifunctional diguanylate cyclase/phosphodiesterase [Halocynthiibacter sp. C4]|uniref:putative bifunctional diguanylate cyclase/phosphodiesterase n=1 Tax=Halocynthiibacter sp. C4 TaxID=2992758 RepID=UPI00237BC95F|nr:bifunctional diguanylate cyclase/phosphodiesterase [Halocynthiibacter sp. C4]MDE0588492.1 bifunctional diguanylate cyclase/phosphodiesterase [Halocynthiibacter sp. C4]
MQLPNAAPQWRTMLKNPSTLAVFLALTPTVSAVSYWIGGEAALLVTAILTPILVLLTLGITKSTSRAPYPRDGLTGLHLREDIENALDEFTAAGKAQGKSTVSMRIELDDFHTILDRYGHRFADDLVLQASKRLQSILRHDDILARLDGGSFAIAFAPVHRAGLETMIQISGRIQSALAQAYHIDSTSVYLTASIGFCLEHSVTAPCGTTLLKAAEDALLEANRQSPAGLRAYSPSSKTNQIARSLFLNEIEGALETGQIRAWFQPQLSTDTGNVVGFEALARWVHPERGVVAPNEFLPIVEQAGFSERLSELMLFQSLSALRDWDAAGFHVETIGVNFSMAELRNPHLLEKIVWELDRFDLPASRLSIEVLENVVADSSDDMITRNINGLSNLGCKVDLDDFGTGHASISNIRRFSVNRIKIDRSFITKLDKDPEQHQMVSAILTMAERLGMKTLAEGVETKGEHTALAQLGCDHVQGFSISKPMPLDETLGWLERHHAKLRKTAEISRKLG